MRLLLAVLLVSRRSLQHRHLIRRLLLRLLLRRPLPILHCRLLRLCPPLPRPLQRQRHRRQRQPRRPCQRQHPHRHLRRANRDANAYANRDANACANRDTDPNANRDAPTPTPTPTPTLTPTPTPTPSVADIIAVRSQSVVRIEAEKSGGSGVVIRADGLILTAYHVVQGASEIKVILPDGNTETGTMLGKDIGRDLAVVRIARTGLTAVPFAPVSSLQVGQPVIKLGYGAGQRGLPAATMGVISAILEPTRMSPALLQVDSALNPGDSGGPLLTRDGDIAAIATAKLVGTTIEGVGYGSIVPDAVTVAAMIEGDTVCQPAPELVNLETKTVTYRQNVWVGMSRSQISTVL